MTNIIITKALIQDHLPEATPIDTYDYSVWAEFYYNGEHWQLFDYWNFGGEIDPADPTRFKLFKVIDETKEEDGYEMIGEFTHPLQALDHIK